MEVGDEILRDGEGDAGHQHGRPDFQHLRKPTKAQISQNGTISEKNGSWRPIMPLSSSRSSPVTAASAITGVPSAPKATGRGVGDQRQAGGRERREAEPDQHRGADRDRRAEAGGTLEEGAEAEGDEQELQPAVVGDVADAALEDLELALLVR